MAPNEAPSRREIVRVVANRADAEAMRIGWDGRRMRLVLVAVAEKDYAIEAWRHRPAFVVSRAEGRYMPLSEVVAK